MPHLPAFAESIMPSPSTEAPVVPASEPVASEPSVAGVEPLSESSEPVALSSSMVGAAVAVPSPAEVLVIDLSLARSLAEYPVSGSLILAQGATDATAWVDIRLGRPSRDAIRFLKLTQVKDVGGFWRFYVSNDAQAGKTLTLLVGGAGLTASVS